MVKTTFYRGGRRKNAGRPQKFKDRKSITVRITDDSKEVLDNLPGSQSEVIEHLIQSTKSQS